MSNSNNKISQSTKLIYACVILSDLFVIYAVLTGLV